MSIKVKIFYHLSKACLSISVHYATQSYTGPAVFEVPVLTISESTRGKDEKNPMFCLATREPPMRKVTRGWK